MSVDIGVEHVADVFYMDSSWKRHQEPYYNMKAVKIQVAVSPSVTTNSTATTNNRCPVQGLPSAEAPWKGNGSRQSQPRSGPAVCHSSLLGLYEEKYNSVPGWARLSGRYTSGTSRKCCHRQYWDLFSLPQLQLLLATTLKRGVGPVIGQQAVVPWCRPSTVIPWGVELCFSL